jgi:sugar/nucleoside kinase (ribokinase family)
VTLSKGLRPRAAQNKTRPGDQTLTSAAFDIVALGNAIVDIIHPAPDQFLAEHGIEKGAMTLIDDARADYLTGLFDKPLVAAGGSVANTATGVASFGGRAAFLGVVADDELGAAFVREFRAVGATFDAKARPTPPGTGRCLIVVTPDGQRSMSTYLGAAGLLTPAHIDADTVRAAEIVFLEGYLFDSDEAKAAFVKAAEIAKAAGRKVALTVSDVFCIERHRPAFRHLVANHVDILLCNEGEVLSLYQTKDFDDALTQARAAVQVVAATRSEKGSVIGCGPEVLHVPAAPVAHVLDTTGAGDQYAAGFLYGYARGKPLAECGALGSLAAAEVIAHMGPRPETSLKALAESQGLRL